MSKFAVAMFPTFAWLVIEILLAVPPNPVPEPEPALILKVPTMAISPVASSTASWLAITILPELPPLPFVLEPFPATA